MPTSISNLWIPSIWVRGVNEKAATLPALITSPVVVKDAQFDAIASGGGVSATIPFFRDISDQTDSVQVENTQPSLQIITSGQMVAPILNREYAVSASALASQVPRTLANMMGPQAPIEVMTAQLGLGRQKRRQSVMVNILNGIFGFANGPGGAGALSAVRNDIFFEAGNNPSAIQKISPNSVIDTIALLGELAPSLVGGCVLMHSKIRGTLVQQDQVSFEHYSLQNGTVLGGPIPRTSPDDFVEMYKGYRVFVSDSLARAGAVNGTVYATYFIQPGVFALGERPQRPQIIDVASLSFWTDTRGNNEELYDRTRFLLHPNGMSFIGTPAGQSASNAELVNPNNWSLVLQTANRVGIACIRSNG